ncbi:H-NS histone family protein, partial [Burkholderia pseudomallei]
MSQYAKIKAQIVELHAQAEEVGRPEIAAEV